MSTDVALRLAEIAADPGPIPERAQALVEELQRHVPFDGSWLAMAEPFGTGYASVAARSLDRSTTDYLGGPKAARDLEISGANRERAPMSPSDLPVPLEEIPTWAECLLPAGYREALGVGLFAPGGRHVGHLALLSASGRRPTAEMRRSLSELAPIIARGIDPMRSLAVAASVVQGATAGVVLCQDGGTAPLPGLAEDALLGRGTALLDAAGHALRAGQVFTSFLWPRGDRHAPDGHVRVTVLAGPNDVPPVSLGMVLLSPSGDVHGLTARELEILGFLIDGRANKEIARALAVTLRTVAAHVEHVLVKLDAPSRTLAAVRAARLGCYVPAAAAARG
ncbi:helix-turn-helix transcriptional regulator [Nocardioides aquiterrae]|uniref:HTH luxR-type domain-containing protein n=1 Tax=Nocardioides aquiterrae TaxID=203799 RepID=A0ABP4F2E5_9ACTN